MDRAVKVAGGLVFQETAEGDIEVLVIDDSFGRVTLPKGHVEPGELIEEAAVREIQEETGIEGKLLAPIAMVSYAFTSREGVTGTKNAYYYLLEAIGGQVKAQLEEVQGARFIPLSTVMDTIMTKGYPNNIDVFVRGTHLIEEWKKKQLVAASKVTLARMSIGTTKQDLTIFCRQTRLYGIASVMVNPLYVKDAVDALKGSETKVCAAIAYPHGAISLAAKRLLIEQALADGATEINVLMATGKLRDGDFDHVREEIETILLHADKKYKCIFTFESGLLTEHQLEQSVAVALACGASDISISSGAVAPFNRPQAIEKIARMTQKTGVRLQAFAESHQRERALHFLEVGADHLLSSATFRLLYGENSVVFHTGTS